MFWKKKDSKQQEPQQQEPQQQEEEEEENEAVSELSNGRSGRSASIAVMNTTTTVDKESTVSYWMDQAAKEKAGKQRIYHSLKKLAEELKRMQRDSNTLKSHADYANKAWHQGGLWRPPSVLPGVQQHRGTHVAQLREPISLSDLFFNLVVVTAFTRVGGAIADLGTLSWSALLYFAVFWTIWGKKASYSTRFDTSDLSAQAETLITCFALLYGCLSINADGMQIGPTADGDDSTMNPLSSVKTEDGTRVMVMAAFCAILHCGLLARVWLWHRNACDPSKLEYHVRRYAQFIVGMNFLEATTWISGIVFLPTDSSWRYLIFALGIAFALRIPRAFLPNDFHAACSKRGVLFILLLGYVLQSVVVIGSDFFQYRSPTFDEYSFIGASCLLLFCIKLLYVDNASTLALHDHALLVNRTAGFIFYLGQFSLLLSTTAMGSGLTLLTHSYLAATAALPDQAKSLVSGGFSAVVTSVFFIKSMHLKRVPTNPNQKALFVGAYCVEAIMTLVIVVVTAAMSFGRGGYLQLIMSSDNEAGQLLWVLSAFAILLVFLGWLDEGLEIALFGSGDSGSNSRRRSDYLVHPFGFWWCLKPEVIVNEVPSSDPPFSDANSGIKFTARGLSEFSPLLGSSMALSDFQPELSQRHSIV